LALACSASAQVAQSQRAEYIADTVTVQAEGTFEADPDLATLSFNVSVTEKELRRAYERASESLNRIMALAERNGLDRKDVATGAFSVTPDIDYRDRKRKPKAYRVESAVLFHVRDFSKLGALIDEAVASDIVEFRSLTFSLADEEEAKVRAVAMARERAEARARAALGNGSRLGAPRFVGVDVKPIERFTRMTGFSSEMGASALIVSRMDREEMPSAPPLPPSTPEKIRVRATVNYVFQIAETK